ncbi:MAG: hypothetical protein WAW00_00775 [Candidatus Moraniibacteriota bacterium]
MTHDATTEEQAHRQTEVRRSQATLFSLQSDESRLKRKQADLQAEIHRMKTEFASLRVSIDEKEARFRSAAREIELIEEEISRTKKHMHTL